MSIEEIEELNPHFRWCKRKMKSRVKHLAKKLALNSFAIGCRGHAGIVVEKTIYHSDITGSDVEIASLLDGVEGGCSIFHCAPEPISREYAMWLSIPFNYEAEGLLSWMKWFEGFDDFDKHYTPEMFAKDKLDFSDKIKKVASLPDADPGFMERIGEQYGRMISGQEFHAPVGFQGEKARWHRAVRPSDFATEKELRELSELAERTRETKQFYGM